MALFSIAIIKWHFLIYLIFLYEILFKLSFRLSLDSVVPDNCENQCEEGETALLLSGCCMKRWVDVNSTSCFAFVAESHAAGSVDSLKESNTRLQNLSFSATFPHFVSILVQPHSCPNLQFLRQPNSCS